MYDNRLREGSHDAVLGSSSFINIGHIPGTGSYRDVMLFNLSMYNRTTKITSANLSLFGYYPPNATRNQSYVNWNNMTYGTPWSSPGGDWFDNNNKSNATSLLAL